MRRGGRRRRYVIPHEVKAWCPGRWGPRRVRVTECAHTIKAEDIYTEMLREGLDMKPGLSGRLRVTRQDGVELQFNATVVNNAVWRRGRVFLICPCCSGRCTRLYMPRLDSLLACRQCWGLTYESRQHANYKDSGPRWAGVFGTHRELAMFQTCGARDRRKYAALTRWAERRALSGGRDC
jgi:hypothetical protein